MLGKARGGLSGEGVLEMTHAPQAWGARPLSHLDGFCFLLPFPIHFLLFSFCLKGRETDLPPAGSLPECQTCWGCARLEPGARNSIRISLEGAGPRHLNRRCLLSPERRPRARRSAPALLLGAAEAPSPGERAPVRELSAGAAHPAARGHECYRSEPSRRLRLSHRGSAVLTQAASFPAWPLEGPWCMPDVPFHTERFHFTFCVCYSQDPRRCLPLPSPS